MALALPQSASANPTGDCIGFVVSRAGGLFGPYVNLDGTITVLVGTGATDSGVVTGIVIDPAQCGGSGTVLDSTVNQASGSGPAGTLPETPLLA